MNQDHVIGGGLGVALATYLPPVLAYFQHPGAPVTDETGLLIAAGAALYAGIVWLVKRRPAAPAKS